MLAFAVLAFAWKARCSYQTVHICSYIYSRLALFGGGGINHLIPFLIEIAILNMYIDELMNFLIDFLNLLLLLWNSM